MPQKPSKKGGACLDDSNKKKKKTAGGAGAKRTKAVGENLEKKRKSETTSLRTLPKKKKKGRPSKSTRTMRRRVKAQKHPTGSFENGNPSLNTYGRRSLNATISGESWVKKKLGTLSPKNGGENPGQVL